MFILTIIGSLIGLILGSFLTLYVIKICETNLFMFTFNINFKICKSLPYGNLPASFLLLHNLLQNQGCNLHLRFRKV